MRWAAVVCVLTACRIDFDSIALDAPVSANAVFGISGAPGSQQGNDVAIGRDGSLAVVGTFQNSLPLGTGVTAIGTTDAFVAKLRGNGDLVWIVDIGGTGEVIADAVAVADNGDVVATGWFGGTVDFGAGAVTALGEEDMFIVRYSAAGTPLWSRSYGGPATGTPYGSDRAQAVAIDPSGLIYIGGQFAGTADFGTGPQTMNASGDDIVLLELDAAGTLQWVLHGGGGAYNKLVAAAADSSGVAVTGYFQGTVDLGTGAIISKGSNDLFVAAIDPSGKVRWASSFGGGLIDYGRGVAFDETGNVYATGYYQGSVDFGSDAHTARGMNDGFVVALSPNGSYLWSTTFDADCAKGEAVVADSSTVRVTGVFGPQMRTPALASSGATDAFVIAYDRQGNARAELAYGGAGDDIAFGMAPLSSGRVVIAGSVGGLDQCNTTGTPVGGEDMFLVPEQSP